MTNHGTVPAPVVDETMMQRMKMMQCMKMMQRMKGVSEAVCETFALTPLC